MLKIDCYNRGILLDILIAKQCGPYPPPAGGHSGTNECVSCPQVMAIKGRGLEGDRWFDVDKFKMPSGECVVFNTPRQVSLISVENIEKFQQAGYDVKASTLRRNLLCKGIDLNALVGHRFRVGSVYMRGVQLCQPCKHIEDYNKATGLIAAMLGRGGLRAEILNDGLLKQGDEICSWHG